MSNEKMTQEADVFDLSMFNTRKQADVGFEVSILDPMGDETGLHITISGQDGATYSKLAEKWTREQQKILLTKNRNAQSELQPLAKQHDLNALVECTLAWRSDNGTMPFPVTDKESLRAFYAASPVVYEQLYNALFDRRNFSKGSVKN